MPDFDLEEEDLRDCPMVVYDDGEPVAFFNMTAAEIAEDKLYYDPLHPRFVDNPPTDEGVYIGGAPIFGGVDHRGTIPFWLIGTTCRVPIPSLGGSACGVSRPCPLHDAAW